MTERLPELVADRRVTIRRFLLLAASSLLGVFGWFLLDDSAALNAEATPGVLAQVDGQAITRAEVERELLPELAALERRRAELWQEAIAERVDELLIEKAAKVAGLTPALYLARELGDAQSPQYQQKRLLLLERLRQSSRIQVYPG